MMMIRRVGPSWWNPVIGLVIAGLGLWWVTNALGRISAGAETVGWDPTPCVIVSKSKEVVRGGRNDRTVARVVFEYTAGGRVRRSSKYSRIEDRPDWREVIHLHEGSPAECRVNPDDPSDAVLIAGAGEQVGWEAAVAAGVLSAGLGLVGYGLSGRPRRITNGPDAGRLRLRPRSRLAKVAMAGGWALAAAAVVLFAAAPLRNTFWALVILAPPAVAVVGPVVWWGLANRLVVTAEAIWLRPRDTLDLRWTFPAGTPPVRLRIRIVGWLLVVNDASALRRRQVQVEPLDTFDLVETADPTEIRSGSVRFGLPSRMDPSDHEGAAWYLEVRWTPPGLPERGEKYDLFVADG